MKTHHIIKALNNKFETILRNVLPKHNLLM